VLLILIHRRMHTLSSHLSPCSIAMRPCTASADPTHQPTLTPPSPSTRQGMQYVPLFQKVLNPSLATPGRMHQASPSPTTLLPTPSKSSLLRATSEELHHVSQRCSPSKEPERIWRNTRSDLPPSLSRVLSTACWSIYTTTPSLFLHM
jgi:hypothetical protein